MLEYGIGGKGGREDTGGGGAGVGWIGLGGFEIVFFFFFAFGCISFPPPSCPPPAAEATPATGSSVPIAPWKVLEISSSTGEAACFFDLFFFLLVVGSSGGASRWTASGPGANVSSEVPVGASALTVSTAAE